MTVACQVRKSLAVTSALKISCRYAFDVGRLDRAPAGAVAEGQQPIAAAPATAQLRDELAHVDVVDHDVVLDPRLAHEREQQGVALLAHVASLQGGETVASVLVGVHVAADPEVADVDEPDRQREDAVLVQSVGLQVGTHLQSRPWQPLRHGEDALELLRVTLTPPLRVVHVLAASGRVGADDLDVPVRVRADPHRLPRGRDHQRLDPRHVLRGQPMARCVEVHEPAARASTRPPHVVGRDVSESHRVLAPRSSGTALLPCTRCARDRSPHPYRAQEPPTADRRPRPQLPCAGVNWCVR